MDWAGNISTFSPELLGLKNADYGDFLLGNINRDALVDLPSGRIARMPRDIEAGVEMCRDRCEYFSVCGGGEPVNKLAENGTFASTETAYCRLTKMRATDLVLDALETCAAWRFRPERSGHFLHGDDYAGAGSQRPLGMNTGNSEDVMNKTFRRLARCCDSCCAADRFGRARIRSRHPAAVRCGSIRFSPQFSWAAASISGWRRGSDGRTHPID